MIAALGDARFIGGCVRDTLLGLPVSDIDIATPLEPAAVIARLQGAGIRVIPTGLAHGTVTAVLNGEPFEITTLRRDVACFGRHAEVAFTDDWLADAARRDFTINALSCTSDGEVYDPFGGLADLAAGHVRFIGSAELRIREDVLRLLRYFRFYVRYGRPPADAEALAACRALAPLLPGLSGERVRAELVRLLASDRCVEGWSLITNANILRHLLPEATRLSRLEALVALETAHGLAGAERAMPRLAALLDTDRAGALAVAGRLRLSREERDRLVALVVPEPAIRPGDEPARLRRALVALDDGVRFCDRVLLAAAADGPMPSAGLAYALALAARWPGVRFPLGGQEVLALGVPAGPALGRLLGDLRGWWADRDFVPDRAACLAEAVRRLSDSR